MALPGETVARVVALTGEPPPGEATHWTGPRRGRGGTSRASMQRIWQAHDLQPYHLKTFNLSNDPTLPPSSGRSTDCTSIRRSHSLVLSVE